ncbi:MAG: putative phosphatase [Verrucomicrobiales bacterium]|nr:putative phosphatase [Verrucomicrobiales bacterium]
MSAVSSNGIEFLQPFQPKQDATHVIFDFDGTLSWIRHGWPGIMLRLFREWLPPQEGETEQALDDLLMRDILSLNGKPTIHQTRSFASIYNARTTRNVDPDLLLEDYQRRLDAAIASRSQNIQTGENQVDDFVVWGARDFLNKLLERKLTLIILSGTIEHRVREEAELLQLSPYFKSHIYGGHSGPGTFTKRAVIDRLMVEEKIEGHHLVSFGDGPVEMAETVAVGGLSIGVASNEELNGSGIMDDFKKDQLTQAGASMLIADFQNPDFLLSRIFGS